MYSEDEFRQALESFGLKDPDELTVELVIEKIKNFPDRRLLWWKYFQIIRFHQKDRVAPNKSIWELMEAENANILSERLQSDAISKFGKETAPIPVFSLRGYSSIVLRPDNPLENLTEEAIKEAVEQGIKNLDEVLESEGLDNFIRNKLHRCEETLQERLELAASRSLLELKWPQMSLRVYTDVNFLNGLHEEFSSGKILDSAMEFECPIWVEFCGEFVGKNEESKRKTKKAITAIVHEDLSLMFNEFIKVIDEFCIQNSIPRIQRVNNQGIEIGFWALD